jgi:hypothetical protein
MQIARNPAVCRIAVEGGGAAPADTDHRMAAAVQVRRDMPADEPGSPHDKYSHVVLTRFS